MSKVICLDRDGVINFDSDDYIKSAAEWCPIPGSLDAVAQLTRLGYRIAVITNQSGIARGLYSETDLQAIHAVMHAQVRAKGGEIAAIYYCPHQPENNCECRKPKPGLLLQASKDLGFDLKQSVFVGDKLSDVQAARAAGTVPCLVKTGYPDWQQLTKQDSDVIVCESLLEFVNKL